MPCDTIQTSDVEMANANTTLLTEALTELGFTVKRLSDTQLSFQKGQTRGTFQDGRLDVRSTGYGQTIDAPTIKVAYARRIVHKASQQFGWKVQSETRSQKRGVAMLIKVKK